VCTCMHQLKRTVAALVSQRTQPGQAAIVTCTNRVVATPDRHSPRRMLGLLGKVREGKIFFESDLYAF
jgi:hypothetical protein